MERRSTLLLGEAQEHYIVQIAARIEMMCRGLPTEPVPQEEIDLFTKAQADKEARRVERLRLENDWNGREDAQQFFMDQFPLGFNPLQPPPMFAQKNYQHMQRVSPVHQGPFWPQFGSLSGQGYQSPPELYHAEFPPLNGQPQHPLSDEQRLPIPVPHTDFRTDFRPSTGTQHQISEADRPISVPHYTNLPREEYERQQVLEEVPQHPQVAPRRSSLLQPQEAEYYVELNKAFLRTWARMESQRHVRYFDEDLFLKLAEWATPAPPGFMWTSWGLISVID